MARARIVVEDATGELLSSEGPVSFGVRTGCDVVLDDPIAAARHCEFLADGSFRVRDLGSVTGTWLDGKRVDLPTAVADGNAIVFGTSRALAKIEDRDGTRTLVLQLKRNDFWWKKPGKKVFDNDPDALVRAEVGFGRFPLLSTSNRVGLIVAAVLLLGATFFASVMAPLADAGPLIPTHALVTSSEVVPGATADFARCRKLADERGCNVCHTTGHGAPASKCVDCHQELVAEKTRRHPYFLGPELGDTLAIGDEQFCTLCHTDHQGQDWLKQSSYAPFEGKCDACHGALGEQALQDLIAKAKPVQVSPRQRPYSTIRFPHNVHVEKKIDCAVCHQFDRSLQQDRARGVPDNPLRDDFAEVPYETCAACHVPGAPAAGLGSEQLAKWQPKKENRWSVAWHGSDDTKSKCKDCHAQKQRDDKTVFGPELKTVVRPLQSAEQMAAERALYATPRRSHEPQFAAHAAGKECTECHLRGAITPGESVRTFWHALHLAPAFLRPGAGKGGEASNNASAGCVSCHQDMLAQKGLTDASKQAYHWPQGVAEQEACSKCHREGERGIALRATSLEIPAARRTAPGDSPADFPHDVHVGSASFAKSGSLQDGCFACHEFAAAPGGDELRAVPRVRPKAADCSQCHAGHAEVGGGQCQQCHPAERERSNSFLVSAGVAAGTLVRGKPAPAVPVRDWPGANDFSHLSKGHADVSCDKCHVQDFKAAATLDVVPVPDESVPATAAACRECHLKKQFHWR